MTKGKKVYLTEEQALELIELRQKLNLEKNLSGIEIIIFLRIN